MKRGKRYVSVLPWTLLACVALSGCYPYRLAHAKDSVDGERTLRVSCRGETQRFSVRSPGKLYAIGDLVLSCVEEPQGCDVEQAGKQLNITSAGAWVQVRASQSAPARLSHGAICFKRGVLPGDCSDNYNLLDVSIDCSQNSALLYKAPHEQTWTYIGQSVPLTTDCPSQSGSSTTPKFQLLVFGESELHSTSGLTMTSLKASNFTAQEVSVELTLANSSSNNPAFLCLDQPCGSVGARRIPVFIDERAMEKKCSSQAQADKLK